MQKKLITTNAKETQKLGELLAEEILTDKRFDLSRPKRPKEVKPRDAFIICLAGDLGSGKTTFTQGLLKGLKVKGPYTSPTFVIMKHYKRGTRNVERGTKKKKTLCDTRYAIHGIFHFDAYRVGAKDIFNLGWEELVADPKNIVIVEWADRIKKIIPKNSLWIKFEWISEKERRIIFK